MKRWLAIGWLVTLGLAVLAAYGWWVYLRPWDAIGTLVGIAIAFGLPIGAVVFNQRGELPSDAAGVLFVGGPALGVGIGTAIAEYPTVRPWVFGIMGVLALIVLTIWALVIVVEG